MPFAWFRMSEGVENTLAQIGWAVAVIGKNWKQPTTINSPYLKYRLYAWNDNQQQYLHHAVNWKSVFFSHQAFFAWNTLTECLELLCVDHFAAIKDLNGWFIANKPLQVQKTVDRKRFQPRNDSGLALCVQTVPLSNIEVYLNGFQHAVIHQAAAEPDLPLYSLFWHVSQRVVQHGHLSWNFKEKKSVN